MSNEKKEQTFKQIGQDLANIDKSILDLFEEYESRLNTLESVLLQAGLRLTIKKITQISDIDKRNMALACLMELLDTLGLKNLEAL